MAFTDQKISLDKSWKFTPQVLILIILGIFVIFGVLILVGQLLKVSQIPPPEESIPESALRQPFFDINGIILAVEEKTDDETIVLVRSDSGQEYRFVVGPETKIFLTSPVIKPEYIELETEPTDREALRVGQPVYVLTTQDLGLIFELSSQDIRGLYLKAKNYEK